MLLVLLKHFAFSPEAELAKNRLEAEGVKSLIQKTGSSGAYTNLIGEADLFVQEVDLEKAKEIIDF